MRPWRRSSAAVALAAAVAMVGCGGGSSRSATSQTSSTLAPPAFGRTVDLRTVQGIVSVEAPGTSARGFVRLSAATRVPVGTKVDTTAGAVQLTAATATPGQVQTGEFHGGIFTIFQRRADRGLTELRISDSHSRASACHAAGTGTARPRLSSRILGLLRGSARGGFRTEGEFAAASVRGTEWGVRNRCDGTLTVVQRGVVIVHDFRLNKDITVRAGQTYLATAS